MRGKKARGVDDVASMGENGLKPIPQLVNIMYENGQWTTHVTAVTRNALQKNPKTTKYTDHRTVSPNTHATKIIARTNKGRTGKRIVEVPVEDPFGFRKEK